MNGSQDKDQSNIGMNDFGINVLSHLYDKPTNVCKFRKHIVTMTKCIT